MILPTIRNKGTYYTAEVAIVPKGVFRRVEPCLKNNELRRYATQSNACRVVKMKARAISYYEKEPVGEIICINA